MARKGRTFEILIEKLEKIVLPTGSTITSPGFIKDKITGQLREVDILILQKIGGSHSKIVIECRDRKSKQDTTWIEQILTKLNDLEVDKKIVVSSSSFSQPAIKKAKFYEIETRTLSEINPETIATWWKVKNIRTYIQQTTLFTAEIGLEYPDQFMEAIAGKTVSDKIFFRKTDEKLFSVSELVPANQITIWNQCVVNGPPLLVSINTTFVNPDDRFFVKMEGKTCDVTRIIFHVFLTIIKKSLPITKAAKYETDEKTVSHIVEFDGIDIEGNKTVQLIQNKDGFMNLSFRP